MFFVWYNNVIKQCSDFPLACVLLFVPINIIIVSIVVSIMIILLYIDVTYIAL